MKSDDRCDALRLLLSDVDGVLTDGGVWLDNQGIEAKNFHIRDGLGIRLWQQAGWSFGIITGRTSHVVQVRARELGIELVRQGVQEKLPVVKQIAAEHQLTLAQVAYIGDDLPDLAVIRACGFGIAVADAIEEVRAAADHVTRLGGGHGAVREVIELILKKQHRWDDLIARYRES